MPKSEDNPAKQRQIERLCAGTPDVLSILSGSVMRRALRDGAARYSSGSYRERDVAGLLSGGKARVIAAIEIARVFPDVPILVNGNTYENTPSDARTMKEELARHGVLPGRVLLQENSYSTFTEIVELVKLATQYRWHRIVVVTNGYQIPRAQELLRRVDSLHDPYGVSKSPDFRAALPRFRELAPELVFVSAEAVLPLRNPCYQKIVDKARASLEWQERTAKEAQGLKQLQEGTYWNGLPRKKKEPFRL